MSSLAEMKSQLSKLEDQKMMLAAELVKTEKRIKISLWGIGIGIVLLPLYWSGLPVLVIAGFMAIYYSIKKSQFQDRLESLETEIHKLEISMA